jgi:hypothetical protein
VIDENKTAVTSVSSKSSIQRRFLHTRKDWTPSRWWPVPTMRHAKNCRQRTSGGPPFLLTNVRTGLRVRWPIPQTGLERTSSFDRRL